MGRAVFFSLIRRALTLANSSGTIAMDRHPAAAYYSIMEAHGLKPSPTFNGYLDMMFNPTGPDQTMFMLASCPATRNVTGAWVAWMPQATIAHAPATGSGSVALDDIQTQMIANCADEMVSAGSFIDAQAFLADVLPVLGASSPSGSTDPAIGRALSVMANLRVGRKSQAIKVVPYLSAAMITQQANNELSALQGLEQQLLAATTQGVTVDSAKAAVEASLPSMNTQIAAAQVELQGDVQHAASLATAFQALQSTYNDRYKDVQAAKDTFTAGVKKAEGDAIGEIVGEFFLDVVTAIATEGAGAGSLVGLLGKAGGLAKLTTGLEKFTALITTISQMIYNLQQLILVSRQIGRERHQPNSFLTVFAFLAVSIISKSFHWFNNCRTCRALRPSTFPPAPPTPSPPPRTFPRSPSPLSSSKTSTTKPPSFWAPLSLKESTAPKILRRTWQSLPMPASTWSTCKSNFSRHRPRLFRLD